MANYNKQDDVGYCINVTPGSVDVLKLKHTDPIFNNCEGKRVFIKSLVDFDSIEHPREFLLDAVTKQFSDKTIDIFMDDESLVKGYPLTAKTWTGIALRGNLVILGSDIDGNSILLNKQQVRQVLYELQFANEPKIQEVDLSEVETELNGNSEYPKMLKHLLNMLINYCVSHDVQLLSRAKAVSPDSNEAVLIMCVYGNEKSVNDLYGDIYKLLGSGKYKR